MKTLFASKLFWLVVGLVIVLALLWSRGLFNPARPQDTIKEVGRTVSRGTQSLIGGGSGFDFPDDVKGKENLAKLRQGCPFKDCIPSIDEPKFESVAEANQWLEDDDVVFALDYKGEQRAYPQRILNWHEIVNDVVAGDPITITFCPLCGSALAFDRRVDGRVLEFGVSGKLHDSDLVMYDRETESLWQQITGEAIVGELFGIKLKQISMDTLRWEEWKKSHPQTTVLSRETGFSRDYSRYPYGSYEEDQSVHFPVEGGVDQTIHPKAVVYGVEVNGKFKAYTLEAIERDTKEDSVITDTVGGERVRLSYNNGEVFVENLRTKGEIVSTRLFWFAWKAFHQETTLYQ